MWSNLLLLAVAATTVQGQTDDASTVGTSGSGSASDGQWQGLNNGESACEGHDDFDAEKCNAVGCCVWDSDYAYCRSDIGTAACPGSTWTVPNCSPCTAYGTDNDGFTEEDGKMHYQQDKDGKCWSIE